MFGKKRLAEAEELIKELEDRKAGIRKNPDGEAWYNTDTKEFLLDFNEDQKTFLRYALQKEIERDQERVAKISQMSRKELKQYKEAKEYEDMQAERGIPGCDADYHEAYRLRELSRPDYYAYDFLDAHDMLELYRIVVASNGRVSTETVNVTPEILYKIIHSSEELNFLDLILGGSEIAVKMHNYLYHNYMEVESYFEVAITQSDFKKIKFNQEEFDKFLDWLEIVRHCYHNQKNVLVVNKPGLVSPSVQKMAQERGFTMKYHFSTKAFLLFAGACHHDHKVDKRGNICFDEDTNTPLKFYGIERIDRNIGKAKNYIQDNIKNYMKEHDVSSEIAANSFFASDDFFALLPFYMLAGRGYVSYRSLLIYSMYNYNMHGDYRDSKTVDAEWETGMKTVDDIFDKNYYHPESERKNKGLFSRKR